MKNQQKADAKNVRNLVHNMGNWLLQHQHHIRIIQWGVVVVYLTLIIVPVLLPLPDNAGHIWNNLTIFAQFIFWGIWWPFVLLSMVLVGRVWCGIFCPEGTLTEAVSRHGMGWSVPKWIKWPGWPFVAFCGTTIYGQMVSVYQYPGPVLVVLGGSTLAAIVIGFLYGRNKRVWCKYLCPVNGVFRLLAKLSPLHYRVDQNAWQESQNRGHVDIANAHFNCAPMVVVRQMQSASECHMCGRCQGFRGAVTFSLRSPGSEITSAHAKQKTNLWDTVLILFGLMGLASMAFHWASSAWYVSLKQLFANFVFDTQQLWIVTADIPWWILTNYPQHHDVMTLLDGVVMLCYLGVGTLLIGGTLFGGLLVTNKIIGSWSWGRLHHLALTLIPLAGAGVFLGLFSLTTQLLKSEGINIPYLQAFRLIIIGLGLIGSIYLGGKVINSLTPNFKQKLLSIMAFTITVFVAGGVWINSLWPKLLPMIFS
ncbi:MAG: 4Fe-4S binding protein [Alphaproteobacteria bacterium]|nr:4Fe-4S binding protein [Alphaproteobacteria bacterium]